MVLSSTILYTTRIYNDFKLSDFIFGNCKIYFNEILLGLLCGFIIGAKGICQKYSKNIDNDTFNNGIFLSSNACIGFVIGCVGCVIYLDVIFGIYLYLAQIISSILIYKTLEKRGNKCNIGVNESNSLGLFNGIVKSIKASTTTILTVCSFNVFFSTLCDLIIKLFNLKQSSICSIILTVLFDFSRGAFAINNFTYIYACGFLTGFCVGFGGICVYMQICAECEGYPFKQMRFFIMKLLQGILCGILCLIYFKIIK